MEKENEIYVRDYRSGIPFDKIMDAVTGARYTTNGVYIERTDQMIP